MDVDYTIGEPHPKITVGSSERHIPVIRMFGITEEGHSVLTNVYGFLPYLFVPVPNGWYKLVADSNEQLRVCSALRKVLNVSSRKLSRARDWYLFRVWWPTRTLAIAARLSKTTCLPSLSSKRRQSCSTLADENTRSSASPWPCLSMLQLPEVWDNI